MTNESIYQVWRPEHSPWSRWVKPVVFPFLTPGDQRSEGYLVKDWSAPLHVDTMIIADLPGAEGIAAGIALARAGYLPVLVYNACPAGTYGASVVVDMSSILSALCAATKELSRHNLSSQSPPVFLLDNNRGGAGISYGPGWFDNRSFVTSSDFPSANYFARHGVSKVILVQPTTKIKADLLQVLLRLQRGGMTVAVQAPWKRWAPVPLHIKPKMFLLSAWEWLRKLGYRRDPFHGCFGEVVPPRSG